MKKYLSAIIMLSVLLFGCTQPQGPVDSPPQEPAMTCEEYCAGQPHIQCVGHAEISGAYPDCACGWVCEQEEPGAQLPNPAAANCDSNGYSYEIRDSSAGQAGYCSYGGKECEEWSLFRMECCLADNDCSAMECSGGAASCHDQQCLCPSAADVDAPVATDKSVRELLEDGLAPLDGQVYSEFGDGSFEIHTYKWLLTGEDDPTQIPIGDAGVGRDILFNEQEVDGLIGFGFKSYVQTDGPHTEARGIAIYDELPALLDGAYVGGTVFDILYGPSNPDRTLEGCIMPVREHFKQLDHNGRVLWLYQFRCDSIG